jgi:hypothetical protein
VKSSFPKIPFILKGSIALAAIVGAAAVSCVSLNRKSSAQQASSHENRTVLLSCSGEAQAQFNITKTGRETVLSGTFNIDGSENVLYAYSSALEQNELENETTLSLNVEGTVEQKSQSAKLQKPLDSQKFQTIEKLSLESFSWNESNELSVVKISYGKKLVEISGCRENKAVVQLLI